MTATLHRFVYLSAEAQYQQAKHTVATVTTRTIHQIQVPMSPCAAKRDNGRLTNTRIRIKAGME
jgi:hypothetical protein